jgi:hypothetical protein
MTAAPDLPGIADSVKKIAASLETLSLMQTRQSSALMRVSDVIVLVLEESWTRESHVFGVYLILHSRKRDITRRNRNDLKSDCCDRVDKQSNN